MLDVLRSNAKSALTWFIVVGIVVVFAINFGPGSLSQSGCGASNAPWAARVNGRVLSPQEWERQYLQLVQTYQAQAGDAFTRELAAQLGLGQQAMDQIVDRELVVQEAKRRGIAVTSQELTKAVHAMPSFQVDGRFDFEVYRDAVRQGWGSTAKFEAALKEDLLYDKMRAALVETVKVSDAEVRDAFEADGDKVALSYARFPIAWAEAEVAKPSAADVEAYAAKQAERIARFHEENRSRFDQKKRVRVRHVLARVAPDADDAAAKKKIETARARLAKGEDFAAVASALSDDAATKAGGGDLGFVTEGPLDDAFSAAALSLAPGAVSEPVRTPAGWHLVKAEEVIPAKRISLEDARLDIARELLTKERAGALATARARAARDAVRKGKALPALFPATGKTVKLGGKDVVAGETGAFGRATTFIPGLGTAPGLLAAAFGAKQGDVLLEETPVGPVLAVVTLRESPDSAAFEAKKGELESRLRNRKEYQVMTGWLQTLRDGAEVQTNPAILAAAAATE